MLQMSRLRLQEEILKHFNEGALDYFDPHLDVVDQAEVLPYDEIWEYPRDSLKFGRKRCDSLWTTFLVISRLPNFSVKFNAMGKYFIL